MRWQYHAVMLVYGRENVFWLQRMIEGTLYESSKHFLSLGAGISLMLQFGQPSKSLNFWRPFNLLMIADTA